MTKTTIRPEFRPEFPALLRALGLTKASVKDMPLSEAGDIVRERVEQVLARAADPVLR